MLCISLNTTNPHVNLATEELMLKYFDRDIFMLWRNDNTIVVGKHQNTMAEINHDFVKENDITVARRLSGGGAVYHDLGNLNFTFIKKDDNPRQADFQKYLQPIMEVLQNMGVNARFEGRNDLTIDGKKFSGNARTVYNNRVLVHGTLLFSSKMEALGKALQTNPLKYKDKSVKSVKSRVTNINEHLDEHMEVTSFRDYIMEQVMHKYGDAEQYTLTEQDKAIIDKLYKEKYATWNWNYGKSPNYNFRKAIRTDGGTIEIQLDVDKGIIKDAKFLGDYFNSEPIENLENALVNIPHDREQVKERLEQFNTEVYFHKVSSEEILQGMF